MHFEVYGPFDITRHGPKKLVDEQSLKNMISELHGSQDGLLEACGCYVFAIRAGRGYTPYYVGQSCKNSIVKEAFNHSNREKYNKALSDSQGTPVFFLLPICTPTGKFRKRRSASGSIRSVTFLERWLISECLRKNPDLINTKETMFLRRIHVRGIFNSRQGEATIASTTLAKTIN